MRKQKSTACRDNVEGKFMYTAFQRLLALMAFDAYRPSNQNLVNLATLGWTIDGRLSLPNRGNGFDATVFHSGSSQVVIAFRGTDTDSLYGIVTDADDDYQIGKGIWSSQVEHALEIWNSPAS